MDILLYCRIILIFVYSWIFITMIVSVITHTIIHDYYDFKKFNSMIIWFCQLYLKRNGLTNTYLDRTDIINYGYRFSKCYGCVIAGHCKHCGCDTVGKFNNPDEVCSANKFGVNMTKEQIDNYFLNPNSNFKINIEE